MLADAFATAWDAVIAVTAVLTDVGFATTLCASVFADAMLTDAQARAFGAEIAIAAMLALLVYALMHALHGYKC